MTNDPNHFSVKPSLGVLGQYETVSIILVMQYGKLNCFDRVVEAQAAELASKRFAVFVAKVPEECDSEAVPLLFKSKEGLERFEFRVAGRSNE